ncbi:MAG: hypothetical protein H0X64_00505 [Gemmatimonadaceae bacterium]|nr:hypothetical protein [Gemmatimonadaceae bacterium]
MAASKPRGKSPRRPGRVSEAVARKNMDMDIRKLAAARRILGTETDTETVDQAIDLVVYRAEVIGSLDRLAAVGGLTEVFPDGGAPQHVRRTRRPR